MEFVSPVDGPYIIWQGKKWLDFSSCDFLGLAKHPEVKKGAIKYSLKYGVSVPPASLKSTPQQQLEGKLAQFLGMETVLLFPSCEEALLWIQQQKAVIISSHLGETPPKKSSVLVCMDDSYTIGVSGEHGFGSGAHQKEIDLIFGSLASGVGCSGAYLAGSKKILDACTPSQPLSFPALGALDSALSFILEMNAERETLASHRNWLEKQLKDLPAKMGVSPRAVLTFKSAKEALTVRQLFLEGQIFLAPPQDQTLYIVLTALHTPDDLAQLSGVLKKLSTTDLALAMQSLTPGPVK